MSFRNFLRPVGAIAVGILLTSCGAEQAPEMEIQPLEVVEPRPDIYADFTLTADLSELTDNQKTMIRLLIDASQIMDDLYWRQAYGDDYESWLESIADADTRRFAELNYGPWDRLEGDKPFMQGVGAKPPGANPISKLSDAGSLLKKVGSIRFLQHSPTTLCSRHLTYTSRFMGYAMICRPPNSAFWVICSSAV